MDLDTGQIWTSERFGVWSPDGTKMIRAACCGTGEVGLDVLDFATGNALRILGQQIYSVAWSPDSQQIAFSSFTGSDTESIHVVAAEGGQTEQVAEIPYDGSLSWSPSENHLVVLAPPGGTGVATLVTLATKETQIIPDSVNDLAWSPDGSLLAYGSQTGLFIMDVNSGVTNQLVRLPTSSNILWSPDGRSLLASIDGFTQIVQLEGDAEPTGLPPGRNYTWSPDSKRVAYINEGCTTQDWDVYVFLVDSGTSTKLTTTPETAKEGLSWVDDGESVVLSDGRQLLSVNAESGEQRVLATVVSEAAGYLHYHANLRGIRGRTYSAADGQYAGFGTSIGGHGLCD